MDNTPIRKGIYQHFKGKLRVLGEGLHTEDMTMFVIYEPLYECTENLFVRPKSMFTEILPNGTPRFKFIRDEY
jgi:hypothetical protein